MQQNQIDRPSQSPSSALDSQELERTKPFFQEILNSSAQHLSLQSNHGRNDGQKLLGANYDSANYNSSNFTYPQVEGQAPKPKTFSTKMKPIEDTSKDKKTDFVNKINHRRTKSIALKNLPFVESKIDLTQFMEKIEPPADDDKETDDQLISEKGIDKEKQSSIRSLRIDNKLQNLGQSSISAIKQDHIRYIKYFVETNDFKPEQHALYQGVQTYGYDQILYFKDQKLFKTRFKGSEPIQQQESRGWLNTDQVTMMTTLGDLLLIGYLDGSVHIFNLVTEQIELEIKGDGLNGAVRDLHYYSSRESTKKYLAILYVQNEGKMRKYSMEQFLFTSQDDCMSSCPRFLFQNDEDSVEASKSEQRREFYWWEQFRCLSDNQFAFLFDHDRKIGIIDCKERCQDGHFGQQNEFHGVFSTKIKTTVQEQEKEQARALFWIFKLPNRKFKNLKPKTRPIGLNSHENIQSQSVLEGEYIFVNKHGIFWKFEGQSRLERIIDTKLDQDKVWKPTDCHLFYKSTKNGQAPFSILIAGLSGLYEYHFKQPEVVPPAKPPLTMKPVLTKINGEKMYRVKQQGRVIFATGIEDFIYMYTLELSSQTNESTLQPLCQIPSLNSRYFKLNADQLFLKSKTLQRWCVVGLQESDIVTTLLPRTRVNCRDKKLQTVLYDSIQSCNDKYAVGIVSDDVSYHPPLILAKYKGFNGEVKAVDLNEGQKNFKDLVLMSKEEANMGFITICVVLHKNFLTWLVVQKEKYQQSEKIVYSRQKDLASKNSNYSQVQILDLGEYFVFGGFFISVFRKSIYDSNPIGHCEDSQEGNAVLTLNDSRPADERAFDKKRYIEINFKEETFNEFQPVVDMIGTEDKSVFPLNDGTLFKVTEQDGLKSIYITKQGQSGSPIQCQTKAQELRLSPDGRSVVMRKGNSYKVAQIDDKAEIPIEFEIKTEYMQGGSKIELRDLKTVYWLSNEYFAIGEFINNVDNPQSYMVYKAKTGITFCRFQLKNEFEFLKNSTAPNLHNTQITGILDKLTNKIYEVSTFTLLHLGAKRFNHNPKGPIVKSERHYINDQLVQKSVLGVPYDGNRLVVLGVHAPALFFTALKSLQEQTELEKKRKMIDDNIFQYTMFQINEDQVVDFQNMFHYLCKNNEPEMLKQWLKPESNYFTLGSIGSPMHLTGITCAKPLQNWLKKYLAQDQLKSLYSELSQQEITAILKLPLDLVKDVCQDIAHDCSDKFSFKSAEIQNKFATLNDLTDLQEDSKRQKLEKELFKYTLKDKKDKNSKHEITPGDPFEVCVSLCKFDMKPGSQGSKSLLNGIQEAGEECPEIYLNKIVKNLLDYKFQQVSWFRHIIFSLQIVFLLLLGILPAYKISDGEVVIIWSVLFMLREASQFSSLIRAGDFKLMDYFGSFWNWLDMTNIAAQWWYFHYFLKDGHEKQKAQAYSFMLLITWLNTLQYLRLYEYFRMLIDLCLKVFQDHQTWKFMVVMGVMLMAFSSSHYMYYLKMSEPVTVGKYFQMIVYTAFGDFAEGEEYGEIVTNECVKYFDNEPDKCETYVTETKSPDYEQIFFFAVSIFVLCLIMLNLLIGILSDVMAKIWETQEESDAAALCDIIGDLESLMFWVSQDPKNNEMHHLVFVEEPEHKIKEGDERTKEIVNETEERLKLEIDTLRQDVQDQFKNQFKKFKKLIEAQNANNKQKD